MAAGAAGAGGNGGELPWWKSCNFGDLGTGAPVLFYKAENHFTNPTLFSVVEDDLGDLGFNICTHWYQKGISQSKFQAQWRKDFPNNTASTVDAVARVALAAGYITRA